MRLWHTELSKSCICKGSVECNRHTCTMGQYLLMTLHQHLEELHLRKDMLPPCTSIGRCAAWTTVIQQACMQSYAPSLRCFRRNVNACRYCLYCCRSGLTHRTPSKCYQFSTLVNYCGVQRINLELQLGPLLAPQHPVTWSSKAMA